MKNQKLIQALKKLKLSNRGLQEIISITNTSFAKKEKILDNIAASTIELKRKNIIGYVAYEKIWNNLEKHPLYQKTII